MQEQLAEKLYYSILDDPTILKRYQEVKIYEEKTGGWAYHGFLHVKNVTLLVEQILESSDFSKEFIYKAKIAVLLHDVGANIGKEDHAYRSYLFAKNYFLLHHILFDDMDLVLEAIRIHSDGFDTDNMIALALILADKLDVKKTRISDAGLQVIGNRQYAHMEDIYLKIEDQILKINFITDGSLDILEFQEYYFTKKIVQAIRSFAFKLHLHYLILIDHNVFDDQEILDCYK